MDYEAARHLANATGHTHPAIYETPGGRFFITCSCGYKSATKTTMRLALESGMHHVVKVAKEAARNGVSVPASRHSA